jgi:23S rRNA (guanine2445-N2)-methyltransferase / 23S rRNA (guanine2069-N7)-methyltransferase
MSTLSPSSESQCPHRLPGTDIFINRLRKNARHLGKWARRQGITCYRLYDADLPEYALAVDLYEGWLHVQEYAAPSTIDPALAAARLRDALAAIADVLDVPSDRVVLKVRRRQKGAAQYTRQASEGQFQLVHEGGLQFWVNLQDYLDTGLFLDHRPTRGMIRELAADRRFLNLFAYTGTASVYAAAGGAAATTTVDMSAVYLDWARRNLRVNGFAEGGRHAFAQADCLGWLDTPRRERFDLIFLDPPTFSNSKRMGARTFDVQRDHGWLLRAALKLLSPAGVLLFSTNFRHFTLDRACLSGVDVQDVSAATVPLDFQRNPRIHHCWKISRRG